MKKLATIFCMLVLVTTCLSACAENKGIETEPTGNETKEGYITNNDICTQDEYEETLFGQPISKERDGEIRLRIKCTSDIYAEITIYEAQDGKYVPIFNCPAVIGENGPGKHAEGGI